MSEVGLRGFDGQVRWSSPASDRAGWFLHPPLLLLLLLPLLRVGLLLSPFLVPLLFWRPSVWPLLLLSLLSVLLLLSSPLVEERLLRYALPLASPSPRQAARLQGLLSSVAGRMRVRADLRVLVEHTSAVSAAPAAGVPYAAVFGSSVLVLSSAAMRLDDELLSGLLAHELAHASSYHGFFSAAEALSTFLIRGLRRLLLAGSLAFPVASLLLLPLLLLLWLLSLPLLLFGLLAVPVRWWSEFSADERAAAAGFAEPMQRLLSSFLSGTFRDRLPSRTHPPLLMRVARLRRLAAV